MAFADSDRYLVVIFEIVTVNVALADSTFWSVFCFTIETANVADATNERYV